jgi:DNA-binding MarR family transcriptional regulator
MSTIAATDAQLAARLRLVVYRMARRLRHHVGGELSPSQVSALASVDRLGPLTLGELSAVEGVRPPTMTRIVASLEEAGLVTRRSDPRDRRVARVAVTAAGGRLLGRSRTRADAYLAAHLDSLGPEDRAAVERAAAVLERILEQEE